MSWLKYAGKRLLMLIPVIICVTFLLYLILAAAPGSLARQLLGDDATPEQIAAKEAEMGLDDPVLVRYVKYMADVCRLDFGESWVNGESVLHPSAQHPAAVRAGHAVCLRCGHPAGDRIGHQTIQSAGLREFVRGHAAVFHPGLLAGHHVSDIVLSDPPLAACVGL